MAVKHLQVRVDEQTRAWLTERAARMHAGSADLQARTELAMWRAVLAAELRRIRLTLGQACCLADILNSTALDATTGRLTWMEASDAFAIARDAPIPDQSSYGAKWNIDEKVLLDWLFDLSAVADHALRDAITRWWEQGEDTTVEGFAKVGLTVVADDVKPAGQR